MKWSFLRDFSTSVSQKLKMENFGVCSNIILLRSFLLFCFRIITGHKNWDDCSFLISNAAIIWPWL